MSHEPGRLREAPEVVCAHIVFVDVWFAVARRACLDRVADVRPGVELSYHVQAWCFDDIFERAARFDWEQHRAAADRQARHALWRLRRKEESCRCANVGAHDVRRPQAPFVDQTSQELSHRIGRDQFRTLLVRVTETWHVESEDPPQWGDAIPDAAEGPKAF